MPRTSAKQVTAVTVVGIDIGKNVFHLIGLDKHGRIALRAKLTRGQLDAQFANMPPCLVGMEACNGAHHLSRKLNRLGHDARIMPAQYVKAFLKGNKNDFRDAEAIAEAVQRPTMKFVTTKTEDQLDLQALHRVRARLVRERTAVINEIRAFLLERGIAVAQGYQRLRKALPDILATREDVLSLRMRHTIEELAEDWRYLDTRIERVSIAIQALAEDGGPCERLMTMPGVAHIISTATVAAIGDGRTFERGRDFAAWLGLVPRQISTGDRTILGKISKRGNPYLRTLYCQAARVVLVKSQLWERYGLKAWIESKRKRLHHNKLAIALANKLARIAWALLTKGRDYEVTRYDPTSPQPA
ncbi:MAG: IS110 family transposase [Hyphomicrobiales bacterium]|nr:MAG: IS110 family transposase [Hyphomicrobiales bacterium]